MSAGTLYEWESTTSRMTLLEISIGIAFTQFWIIVLWNLIKPCISAGRKCKQTNDAINQEIYDNITHEPIEDPELEPFITHNKRDYYTMPSKSTY